MFRCLGCRDCRYLLHLHDPENPQWDLVYECRIIHFYYLYVFQSVCTPLNFHIYYSCGLAHDDCPRSGWAYWDC